MLVVGPWIVDVVGNEACIPGCLDFGFVDGSWYGLVFVQIEDEGAFEIERNTSLFVNGGRDQQETQAFGW